MPDSLLATGAASSTDAGDAEIDPQLVADAVAALRETPPRLPTQYLYDARGSELFERITELPEYYPTRTENRIFDDHLPEMAETLGPDRFVIELGSGAGAKTQRLLRAMHAPAGLMPIEISQSALDASVDQLKAALPGLRLVPHCGDFTHDLTLPDTGEHRRVVFFPGSTLGNFRERPARQLLGRMANWVGPGGGLLLGVDLIKPPGLLVPAYSDAQGVTAAFNLNLLHRLNREADADFDPEQWHHRAVWNADASRMESYLVSEAQQAVTIDGHTFEFEPGQAVWTEQSQKYTLEMIDDLAERFTIKDHWTDARGWMAVIYLEVGE